MAYVVMRYLNRDNKPETDADARWDRFILINFSIKEDAILFCKAAALRDEAVDLYEKVYENGDYCYHEISKETWERLDEEVFESE